MLMPKYNHVVTSTPIKKQRIQLLKSDQWPSPVERTPTQTSTALLTDPYSLGEGNKDKNLGHLNDKKLEQLEELTPAAMRSIDQISLINNSPMAVNAEKKSASIEEVGVKIAEKKQWVFVDSEEEEIRKSRSKNAKRKKSASLSAEAESLTKKKKSLKKSVAKSSMTTRKEKQEKDLNNVADIKLRIDRKPREDISRSKSASGILRAKRREKSLDDPDLPILLATKKTHMTETSPTNETMIVRKSTRKRYQPLEFWNGERISIVSDLSVKSEKKRKYNSKKIKALDSEPERIEQVDEISAGVLNVHKSNNLGKNINAETEDKKKERVKTRSQSAKSKNSKAKVRFSLAGNKTTTDRPANDENLRPGGQMNCVELQALILRKLPTHKKYVAIPQMKDIMGTISSTVIIIKPKSLYKTQASDQHNLIFCVMNGTVKAVIENLETNEEMKPCWHFVVPRGASYSIENLDTTRAILSRFEIACRTKYVKHRS